MVYKGMAQGFGGKENETKTIFLVLLHLHMLNRFLVSFPFPKTLLHTKGEWLVT